jgi:hypothetical protein
MAEMLHASEVRNTLARNQMAHYILLFLCKSHIIEGVVFLRFSS